MQNDARSSASRVRTVDAQTVIAEIIALARGLAADALSESTVSLTHPDLYDAALTEFGGWDVALAEALRLTLASTAAGAPRRTRRGPGAGTGLEEQDAWDDHGDGDGDGDDFDHDDDGGGGGGGGGGRVARPTVAAPVQLDRDPHPDALRPVAARTDAGYLLATPARWFAGALEVTAPRSLMRWPADVGRPIGFCDLGEASGLAGLADDGRVFGWDIRLLPDAEVGEGLRRLGATHAVQRWVSVRDRDTLAKTGVVVSVSARGKVKASDADMLPRPVNADGTVACLIDSGDELVDLVPVGLQDGLLLIASNAFGIHFAIEEVRPMGLRAAGVIGMKLRGGARVVGALVPGRHEEVAVISAKGLAKRMPVEEFRPQSRAGLGLVAGKLVRGDRLVAAIGLTPPADVLITTDHGRCVRVPAELLPAMGRPARGLRVVDLEPTESVIDLAVLLPMAFGP
jgi:hypothetical protein